MRESLRRKYRALAFARVEELFQKKIEVPYVEVFCKAIAMPLVTEVELVDFLGRHPSLELRLEGIRRQKPNFQKNDLVVKIGAAN